MSKKGAERSQKSASEVLVIQPKRLFTYPNGDEYYGEYIMNLKLKTITRHGQGTYTTITCQRYIGEWLDDRIVSNIKILFPKDQRYDGYVTDLNEYMIGQFYFGDGSRLLGDFKRNVENNNSSALEFYDPNDKKWQIDFSHEDKLIKLTLPKIDLINI